MMASTELGHVTFFLPFRLMTVSMTWTVIVPWASAEGVGSGLLEGTPAGEGVRPLGRLTFCHLSVVVWSGPHGPNPVAFRVTAGEGVPGVAAGGSGHPPWPDPGSRRRWSTRSPSGTSRFLRGSCDPDQGRSGHLGPRTASPETRRVLYSGDVSASGDSARLDSVRRFLLGIAKDRSADVLSLLSPTVVYAVPGKSPLSGEFRGPAEVGEHIGELFRLTSGTFEVLKWVDWLVGLNHVAALQFAQAQGSGAVFRTHVVYVVETDPQDLISSIRVFFENQSAAESFFRSLQWD